jgi:hypothetical protein
MSGSERYPHPVLFALLLAALLATCALLTVAIAHLPRAGGQLGA